jgi:ABC-type phosphate/phosphonate transport system substrate-binding protein
MSPRARAFSAILIAVFTIAAAPALPLRIGVPAGESGLETIHCWSVLTEHLRSRGVETSFEVMESNAAVVRALRERFVDVGFLDPLWLFRNRDSLAPLVETGSAGSRNAALVIVPKNSIVHRLEDLSGASFALPSRKETACGYYVPLAMLSRKGVRLSDPGKAVYAETGLSVLKGVAYGGIEGGCLSAALLADERYANFAAEVRVVAESEPLPAPLLAIRREDGEARYRALREELTGLAASPAGIAVLASAGLSGFVPPAVKEYGALERYLRDYKATYGAED